MKKSSLASTRTSDENDSVVGCTGRPVKNVTFDLSDRCDDGHPADAQSICSSIANSGRSQSTGSLASWVPTSISNLVVSVVIPVRSLCGNIQERWKNYVDTTLIRVPGNEEWIQVQHDKTFASALQKIIQSNQRWIQRLQRLPRERSSSVKEVGRAFISALIASTNTVKLSSFL